MMSNACTLLFLLAAPAAAHLALWHPSVYGYSDDYSNVEPHIKKPFEEWWFHKKKHDPPAAGQFMMLPAGGTFIGSISCRKSESMFGNNHQPVSCTPDPNDNDSRYNAMHLLSDKGQPIVTRGTAIGIAYQSDPEKLQPEDFAVITTNRSSPYWSRVDYDIPAGLPPCPKGGCHCAWGWIHGPEHGGDENYHVVFRCKVTGDTGKGTLPKPAVPKRCAGKPTACVKGLKQMIYWANERSNVPLDGSGPPYYNEEMGYTDGAQSLDGVTPPGKSTKTRTKTKARPTKTTTKAATKTTARRKCLKSQKVRRSKRHFRRHNH